MPEYNASAFHRKRVLLEVNGSKSQIHCRGRKKFLSVWKSPYPIHHMKRRTKINGASLPHYRTLSSALRQINAEDKHKNKVQWNIYGLKFQDKTAIEQDSHSSRFRLYSLPKVTSVDMLTWQSCQAYIDPDIDGDAINFLALSTLWLGIPTIISKTSATGRFLQQVDCAKKALVELSGDSETDREKWQQKVNEVILNEDAKPMLWAKEISEYFHNTPKLWEIDLSVLKTNERRLSADSISSFITARDQPHPDIVAKVEPWLQKTMVKR